MKMANKCPECGSKKIMTNNEGVVCQKCGLIISEPLFSGSKAVV